MRKKVLFIMNNLHCGGAEKSLVSLLNSFDYSKYQVDLLLFKQEGMFMKQLPAEVSLIKELPNYHLFDMPISQALKLCLKQQNYKAAIARIKAGVLFRGRDSAARKEQRLWKHLSKALPTLEGTYDAAIGYLEKTPVYFCLDKVQAKVKIAFIHTDYERLGMDPELDQSRFARLDYIVTVSDKCAEVLARLFPQHVAKLRVIHNIVSPELIQLMANDNMDKTKSSPERLTVVSVGRLTSLKGFDLAAHACRMLVDRGIPVQWYIIGEGEERPKLEQLIDRLSLNNHFFLLGLKDNPYTFIRKADLYVQPSRFEGKSIAIDEAKILGKPIIVTNFSTAADQIQHGMNGWIVEMNPEAICNGIALLAADTSLRQKFMNNLKKEELGTENEIAKLYELIS